jgi:hypothetical protein
MSIDRKTALKRLQGLADVVEEHLQKIAAKPGSDRVAHYRAEIRGWLIQMKAVLPYIGRKTAAVWSARLTNYETTLEEERNE